MRIAFFCIVLYPNNTKYAIDQSSFLSKSISSSPTTSVTYRFTPCLSS
jgi:hypothetical protein